MKVGWYNVVLCDYDVFFTVPVMVLVVYQFIKCEFPVYFAGISSCYPLVLYFLFALSFNISIGLCLIVWSSPDFFHLCRVVFPVCLLVCSPCVLLWLWQTVVYYLSLKPINPAYFPCFDRFPNKIQLARIPSSPSHQHLGPNPVSWPQRSTFTWHDHNHKILIVIFCCLIQTDNFE